MKTDFSFQRYIRTLHRDLIYEFKKNILQTALAWSGILAALSALISLKYYSISASEVIRLQLSGPLTNFHETAFSLFLLVMIANINNRYTDRGNLAAWLMLPASQVEKFTVTLTKCFVIYPIVYAGIWFVSELLRMLIIFVLEWGAPGSLIFIVPDFFSDSPWETLTTILEALVLLTYFLLGSYVFRKHAAYKTLLSGMLQIALFSFIGGFMIALQNERTEIMPRLITFTNEIRQNLTLTYTLNILISSFFIVLNLILSYLRFKESEIIHRH